MNILQGIRDSRIFKVKAIFIGILMPLQGILPNNLFAGTGGPTQPEYSSFTAVSASNLVDPFTGNVGYSVPLLEIGGYPVTMSYSGDISPEQDAGWVGLGWSLNIGSINRALRGVPDDFDGLNGSDDGDKVIVKEKRLPHKTYKMDLSGLFEKSKELNVVTTGKAGALSQWMNSKKNTHNAKIHVLFDNYTGFGFGYGYNYSKSKSNEQLKDNQENFVSCENKETLFDKKTAAALNVISDNDYDYSSSKYTIDADYNSRQGLNLGADISAKNYFHSGLWGLNVPVSASVNSRSGKASLGLTTGFNSKSVTAAYEFNFLYHPFIQEPLTPSRQISTDFLVDISDPRVFINKRKYSMVLSYQYESLVNKEVSYPAYGLISDMNDFHQGRKDFEIHDAEELPKFVDKKTRQMPGASVNYDVFNISAAGVGGSFRVNPNYLQMHGPATYIKNQGINGVHGKLEFGLGKTGSSEFGLNLGVNIKREKYESLDKSDFVGNDFHFDREVDNGSSADFQKYTMRNDFEFIPQQASYINGFDGDKLALLKLRPKKRGIVQRKYKSVFDVIGDMRNYSVSPLEVSSQIIKAARDPRQQVITRMRADEARDHSFMPKLVTCQVDASGNPIIDNTNGNYQVLQTEIDRVSTIRKSHHISEFTVTQPDGSRYYFGTPVYNYKQIDYKFNVSENESSGTPVNNYHYHNGTVNYFVSSSNTSGWDDLENNAKGIDQYSYKKTIPGHAHAYLLNAVLSSDYVDKTGNGPSEDDLGSYVKFSYWQAYGAENTSTNHQLFSWRSLTGQYTADLDLGVKSDDLDDKGYFTYGEKEIWYLTSIETKDQIALFYLGNRQDGGQVNLHGVVDRANGQYYLRKVQLFNKNEFKKYGSAAEPVKTVYLEYSYDLCKGYSYNQPQVINGFVHPITGLANDYNKGGKLTLHKVWFTYGKQNAPLAAPYVFEYKGFNPDFEYKSVDRWGTYKPLLNTSLASSNQILTSQEFPYTSQDKGLTDLYSAAWQLTDITLPSGGSIHIDYESDDYGYVQDKPAMQMLKVAAISPHKSMPASGKPTNLLFNPDADNSDDREHAGGEAKNRFIIFELPAGISDPAEIISPGEMMYYNFMVQMMPGLGTTAQKTYEPVNGFFTIHTIGKINSQYAFVEMKTEKAGIFKTNPIVRNAIQEGMQRTPWYFYPGSDMRKGMMGDKHVKAKKIGSMLLGFFTELGQMLTNKYWYFIASRHAQRVDLDRSFVRVYSPHKLKLGGGHRVKSVSISDNWTAMTGGNENTASYTIAYTYKTADGNSSGVATYEPQVGADENPFKYPLDIYETRYLTDKKLKKKYDGDHNYKKDWRGSISMDLGPTCEPFYPSPSVGYGRVVTQTVYPTSNVAAYNRHKTGYTVQEFYTSKDFPTFSQASPLEKRQTNINGVDFGMTFKPIKGKTNDQKVKKTTTSVDMSMSLHYSLASQGFLIKLNDMHGKPKSNLVYTEDDPLHPFSGSSYFYKVDGNGELQNNVSVIHENGVVSNETMGLDVEPFLFGSKLTSTIHSIRPNLDVDNEKTLVSVGYLLGYNLERSTSKVVTMTKLVRQTGIVDSVVVYDKGAATSTKNIAWDRLTGQVLVTSVKNEYGDTRYSLTKPAHWMHPGIAGAYQNIDYTATTLIVSGSGSGLPPAGSAEDNSQLLFPGDELMVYSGPGNCPKTLWVLDRFGNRVSLIGKDGSIAPPGTYTCKVIRSGHRNILGAGAETVLTTKVPFAVIDNVLRLYIDPESVISAKGITFDDKRQVYQYLSACWNKVCDSVAPEPGSSTIPAEGVPQWVSCQNENGGGNGSNFLCVSDGYMPGATVNPYTCGILGVWKPFGDYSYHDKRNNYAERTQTQAPGNNYDANYTNTRTDGLLKNYLEFWSWHGTKWEPRTTQDSSNPWTWAETLANTDEKGNHTQTVNALNIYSAALYGYNDRRLVTATAANAKANEILFDGFEDIDPLSAISWFCNGNSPGNTIGPGSEFASDFCQSVRHWPIVKALIGGKASVTSAVSHTGWKSLSLKKGSVQIELESHQNAGNGSNTGLLSAYTLTDKDFIKRFNPTPGKEYLISYWVKSADLKTIDNNQFGIEIISKIPSGYVVNNLTTVGEVTEVDGWKKFTYKFVPLSDVLKITFINNGNTALASDKQQVYLDDIRIHPVQSSMVSYVYDCFKYRLMSTLDDNNYAVFFEYDEEGDLIRKKVETIRGVMTVDEKRNSIRK